MMTRTLDFNCVDIVGSRVKPLVHVSNMTQYQSHFNRERLYQVILTFSTHIFLYTSIRLKWYIMFCYKMLLLGLSWFGYQLDWGGHVRTWLYHQDCKTAGWIHAINLLRSALFTINVVSELLEYTKWKQSKSHTSLTTLCSFFLLS